VDERTILNRRIAIGEGISKLLEAMAVGIGREITLNKIVEFALYMNSTTWLIPCKQIFKVHPNLASSGFVKLQTHIHEIIRESGVEPVTNKEIFLGPLKIRRMVVTLQDVRKEIEAPKNHGKQSAPFRVVVGFKIKSIGYQRLDGDAVEGMRHGHCMSHGGWRPSIDWCSDGRRRERAGAGASAVAGGGNQSHEHRIAGCRWRKIP
jgi:hypothetical protein